MIFKSFKYVNLEDTLMGRKIERTIMQIGKLSLHTSKNSQKANLNSEKQSKSTGTLNTNPFGISFKGNVIQADVFEGKKQSNNSIAEKGRIFASAVVSGINNFNESFKSRMNSIISFGKKVTTDAFDKIEQIGNTEITFDMEGIKNKLFPDREYSVKNLTNKSVDELKTKWTDLTPEVV